MNLLLGELAMPPTPDRGQFHHELWARTSFAAVDNAYQLDE
jgi:hypothetical protein